MNDGSCKPNVNPEITGSLHKEIAELNDLISQLATRLTCVMLNADEKLVGGQPQPSPPMSPLRADIATAMSNVTRANFSIRRILDKLDV